MTVNYLLMDNRIRLEKQNKPNNQVIELILDNCRASHISGLTDEFVNLETLSISNVGLVTLKGFPKLPNLKKLELCDNQLSDGLNFLLGCSKLQELNLSGNNFRDLCSLEPLRGFRDLTNLDLYNCEITKFSDYKQKVFDLIPNLQLLDGFDRSENESTQPPLEQLTNVVDDIRQNVDTPITCPPVKEDTSMVVETESTETCPAKEDPAMIVESEIKEPSCPVKDDNATMVVEETCPATKETPMPVDNAMDEGVSCPSKNDNSVRVDNSINVSFCPVNQHENINNEDTTGSEKDAAALKVDEEDNSLAVNVDISARIEIENKDSIQEGSLEIVEHDEKNVIHDKEEVPVVEESGNQVSIIEISADHDSSNDDREEEVADSSENPQELSNEEEEDITGSSEGYEYVEDGELEEGECLDEEEDEDEEELDESDTQNQTNEISSDDGSENQENGGELQEESNQLQELSGMQADSSQVQVEEQEQEQHESEEEPNQVQEEGNGGDEQSEDVEK